MSLLEKRGAARTRRSPGSIATRVSLAFLAVGVAWVLVTDLILYVTVERPKAAALIETGKGWMFVLLSAAFIYVVTDRHVSRVQRSEATLRETLNSIADGILLVGPDGRVVDVNPAALRMLGVADKAGIVGTDAPTFSRRFRWQYLDGTLVPVDRYVSQRVLRGEPVASYKARLFPESGGAPLVISSSAAPVRLQPDGKVELSVSVLTDITRLEELDRLRDDFFAAAAHSLRTPVTVIKGHAQFLAARAKSPGDRRVAEALDRQCGRIDRLVQNLIILSRLESGTILLRPTEVELRSLAEMVLRDMRKVSPQHTLRELWRAEPTVFGDPDRLATALRNLIERAYSTSLPNSEVELVLDEADHRARFGVRYHPWETPASGASLQVEERYAGLDVGTHVSERLVEAHGGQLHVEASGDWTTTWVELPTVENPANAHA